MTDIPIDLSAEYSTFLELFKAFERNLELIRGGEGCGVVEDFDAQKRDNRHRDKICRILYLLMWYKDVSLSSCHDGNEEMKEKKGQLRGVGGESLERSTRLLIGNRVLSDLARLSVSSQDHVSSH